MLRPLTRQLALGYTWPIFLAVSALAVFGTVSIRAYSPGEANKQLAFIALSFILLLVIQGFHYQEAARYAWGVYLLSLLPVLYTIGGRFLNLPLAPPVNGQCNWIDLGAFKIQPSELTKISMVLLLARTLRMGVQKPSLRTLIQPFSITFLTIGLIMLQPDLGTALTLLPPLFVMLYVAGQRARELILVIALAVLISPLLWFSGTCSKSGCTLCPHLPVLRHLPQFVNHNQRGRVYALFSDDPRWLLVEGYQQQRALEAFGSGGLMGKGAGNIPIGHTIPEPHTDMIYALIGEQFGLMGAAATLLAYTILYCGGLSIAFANRDPTGRLLAVGLVTLLAGQTLLNLAVAMRLMPVTGVTLPFVSYGGSSMVTSFIAVGLLVNIARNRPSFMGRRAL